MGRFINADGYASTGQGLLGNNMFAYCNNSPVSYADHSGQRMVYAPDCGGSGSPVKSETDVEPPIKKKMDQLGVSYTPNTTTGNGGRINNSYKVTDGHDMTLYARYLKDTTDDFSGSVEGMVFEWQLHNILYDLTDETNEWHNKAKDVDLGRTIYDDDHSMSEMMWAAYRSLYPDQAAADLEIYWDYAGG